MPFNRLNHSILGEIRPRFKLKIDVEPEKALNHLEGAIPKDPTVSGERSMGVVFVRIPKSKQHYWSPELTVRIEKEEFTDYTTVSCLVGPRQSVWAMFSFMYAVIFLISTFAGIFGFVKYINHNDASWLWVIPTGMIFTASIFITSKIGQRKGRDQMLHLISFVYHSLSKISKVERLG